MLRRGTSAGVVYFSGGSIVHAESPRGMGKAALFDLLEWESGAFELEKDAAPPVRTIDQAWTSLLDEAEEFLAVSRKQLETGTPSIGPRAPGSGSGRALAPEGDLSPSDRVVRRLRAIAGVQEALLSGRNGEVLAHAGDGDPERLAAVTAFVGEAAVNVGRPLSLGELRRGAVALAGHRVVVTAFGSGFAGLRLAAEASVDQVCSEARGLLGWS
jgi:predicted regulator of Ras-like GTPase activity (Roadblock/LC7/MglB family)